MVADRTVAEDGVETQLDAVVVGAGFAGLYMLHRLRGLGLAARVYEAGSGVGGTWFWNRYPGARCDVDSMEYSYQFSQELQQEWEWTERYATQPEILKYANHVADRFELRPDIQLETRVTAAVFDESEGRWRVETDRGDRVSSRFCIMATGCLSSMNTPDFPGSASFKGDTYHTGRWPHEGVDFRGKRVGTVLDWRHRAFHTFLRVGLNKVPPNFRILVFIINKRSTLPDFVIHPASFDIPRRCQRVGASVARYVACRHLARAHVLVEPAVRRSIYTVRPPLDLENLVCVSVLPWVDSKLLGPKVYVALAFEAHEHSAWTMVMGLVVSADRPLGNMAHRETSGHPVTCKLPARHLLLVVVYIFPIHITNEVRIPRSGVVSSFSNTVLRLVEIIFLAVVVICEVMLGVEDELDLV